MASKFDVVILGAGAAGLMCAVEAGKRGRRVAVLERAEKSKEDSDFRRRALQLHEYSLHAREFHFGESAFCEIRPGAIHAAGFPRAVEKHRIPYHEKTLGQLFCDRAASDITQMLEEEYGAAGVQTFLNQRIQEVGKTTEFFLKTDVEEFRAPVLVVATGGLSVPKIGATSFGYSVARQFGVKIQKTRPALVPLTLHAKDQRNYFELSGVSMEVVAQQVDQRSGRKC